MQESSSKLGVVWVALGCVALITTVLYRLLLGTVVDTVPTIGNNVESIKVGNLNLQVWDLGGQASLRKTWAKYYEESRAIIYVVDASDNSCMNEAKTEMWNMIQEVTNAELKPCVLVFANKQDKRDALNPATLGARLGLSSLKSHTWTIVPCCALTGNGLSTGMDWIADQLNKA